MRIVSAFSDADNKFIGDNNLEGLSDSYNLLWENEVIEEGQWVDVWKVVLLRVLYNYDACADGMEKVLDSESLEHLWNTADEGDDGFRGWMLQQLYTHCPAFKEREDLRLGGAQGVSKEEAEKQVAAAIVDPSCSATVCKNMSDDLARLVSGIPTTTYFTAQANVISYPEYISSLYHDDGDDGVGDVFEAAVIFNYVLIEYRELVAIDTVAKAKAEQFVQERGPDLLKDDNEDEDDDD